MTCRMRSSGRFGLVSSAALRLRERPRPSLLARAQPAIPQIDERLEPGLQRLEPEALAGVDEMRAIDALDHRLDAAARFPRRPRQPAGEEHVVLRLQPLQLALEHRQLAVDVELLLGHERS